MMVSLLQNLDEFPLSRSTMSKTCASNHCRLCAAFGPDVIAVAERSLSPLRCVQDLARARFSKTRLRIGKFWSCWDWEAKVMW
jgi:hypothetical protein